MLALQSGVQELADRATTSSRCRCPRRRESRGPRSIPIRWPGECLRRFRDTPVQPHRRPAETPSSRILRSVRPTQPVGVPGDTVVRSFDCASLAQVADEVFHVARDLVRVGTAESHIEVVALAKDPAIALHVAAEEQFGNFAVNLRLRGLRSRPSRTRFPARGLELVILCCRGSGRQGRSVLRRRRACARESRR